MKIQIPTKLMTKTEDVICVTVILNVEVDLKKILKL